MKTTRTTVFLSLAILASFLFASSAAFAQYTDNNMPGETLDTGSGSVSFTITGTNPVYYGGAISGSGSITKTGKGELVLTWPSTDYSGAIDVNAGTLTLAGSGQLSGSVTVNYNNNNVSIFKCGATYSGITSLTVNGGTYEIGDNYDSTAGNYLSDFTLTGGYIEFDAYTFVSGAEGENLPLDYLYVNNGVLNSGVINLTFRSNDEMAWHDGAPTEGYPIIDAGADLTFNENAIKIYADGQQTDNWYLSKVGNSIYLKPKSSSGDDPDDPPLDDPWYYANSQTDLSRNVWEMNKNPKIGVKFPEGNLNTAEFGSADNPKSIVMTKNGDGSFTQGEYQIADGKTLTIYATISGDADLLKTGAGTLILNADNVYEGDTYIQEGTLTLVMPDPATDHKGTLKGGTTITVDGALHMNDNSKAKSILSGQRDIFGNRASSGDNATSIGKIRLINGGILQNDIGTAHTTVSCVVEMENGIIQVKEAGAGSDSGGNFLFDNAIHVISGENNQITARTIAIRRHDYATYDQDNNQYAGYFNVEDGATLTMTSEVKNYNDQTIPFVKTGKGELILNNYSDSEICRFTNLNGDFIVREGKVISNKKKDAQSTFGKGAVIVEKDGWLECHVSNQFGYENTVQKDITVYGTLKPSTNTHMHELNLIGGTVETEYKTADTGDGLDFHNRAGKITSSGDSIIKSKVTSGKVADKGGPGTMQFDVTDGNLTITGLVVGTSPFTKTGAGTLTLTNANTMSDSFTIANGVVVAANATALGTGAVTIGSSDDAVGQLTIGETSATALNLTVSGLVTVDGGQINFDFTADNTFDTLIASNGFTFTTGTFNLNFAQGTEATWYENAPEAGYKIVSITGGYTGEADLSAFLSGRTEPWTLTATTDGIYLGQADDPSSLYWNPITDEGKNWPIDGTEKIGVKYNEESNPDDVKTASHDENITLDSDSVFIIGDGYEFEQVGPISGDGDLTKTEGGTLVLSGDNTYTGDTIVSGGTLELNKDNAIATSGNVTNNATIESTGDQTLNNLSGTNAEAEINADDGTLLLNNAPNTNTRYDGTINGTAKVKKTGFGSLLLTGENSYTGGTEIDAGSLVLLTDEESNGTAGVGPIEIGQNGELVYNVAEGQTKQIENKITGAGTITKTGAGKLQAHPTNDMPLQAGSFNVNQGQFDLLGEFEGNLNVGPLNEDGTEVVNENAKAVFSPGNSVGDATVYGDVNINAKSTGLFEFDRYHADPAGYFDTLTIVGDDATFTISDDAVIKLSFLAGDAAAWAEEGNQYHIVNDPGFVDGDYNPWLANYKDYFDLVGQNGDGLYLIGRGAPKDPGVPEPSTWALLILGVAGLCWMRRKK